MAISAGDGRRRGVDAQGLEGPRREAGAARRAVARTATALCLVAAAAGGACLGLYRADAERLRNIAELVVAEESDRGRQVVQLTQWVFDNQGFAENRGYFVWRRLRATPVQVLEGGGDCADKSRLLSCMLRQIGIRATMAMCFDPMTRRPVHTVVEAEIAPNQHMVVDPVYNLTFPRPEGGYFGLLDLRENSRILQDRVRELRQSQPRRSPIHSYRHDATVYDLASTFNWDKNFAARAIFKVIRGSIGENVYRLRRPALLEEPQLAIAAFAFAISAGAAACAWVVGGPSGKRVLSVRSASSTEVLSPTGAFSPAMGRERGCQSETRNAQRGAGLGGARLRSLASTSASCGR